jgi:hypothetical protein
MAVFVPPTRRNATRWSRTRRKSGPFSPTIPAGGAGSSVASGRCAGEFGSEGAVGVGAVGVGDVGVGDDGATMMGSLSCSMMRSFDPREGDRRRTIGAAQRRHTLDRCASTDYRDGHADPASTEPARGGSGRLEPRPEPRLDVAQIVVSAALDALVSTD